MRYDGRAALVMLIIMRILQAVGGAMVMANGLANVFYMWGKVWRLEHVLGVALAWLNAVLFFLFLVPWLLRWFIYLAEVKRDLDHPIMGNFFVTMPVGLMIVGSNGILMGSSFFSSKFVFGFSAVAWVIGLAGALLLGIYGSYNMMRMEQTPPQMMNFSWLISPVASILIPLVGNPLAQMVNLVNPSVAKNRVQ